MHMIWQPDTCDCIIELDETGQHVATHARCNMHEGKEAEHLREVLAHHVPFNDLSRYHSDKSRADADRERRLDAKGDPIMGETPAEKHLRWLSIQAKEAECERIRRLKEKKGKRDGA